MKHKNILITGGCGFIGSNLAEHCVALDNNVTILDSMIPDYGGNTFNLQNIKNKVTINYSDLRDHHSLKYLVQNQDIIFNLAGQVSHIDSMIDPVTDLEINTKAQLNLLECCREYNPNVKIIFTSTRQIYGKPKIIPVNESHPINPTDINGINKYSAEKMHSLYHDVYNLKTVSLRLTNVYGPKQLIKHNKQGFTGIFIREALLGNTIKLFGDGLQKRDFNYVDDVVDALILAANNDKAIGNTYNLGYPKPYSLLDFVKILQTYCNVNYEIVPFPTEKKKIDIGDYQGDFSKINQDLLWTPKTSLDTGLKKTVSYFKSYFEHYYQKP